MSRDSIAQELDAVLQYQAEDGMVYSTLFGLRSARHFESAIAEKRVRRQNRKNKAKAV